VVNDVLPFLILSSIAVVAALATITSRNAIHAALFLVINLGTIAVLYLALNAPFLAMVQIAVYAGAIMVLFLFVIMLLGAERLGRRSKLEWQTPLALFLALVLIAEGAYLFFERLGSTSGFGQSGVESSPQAVGEVLFGNYLFAFEIISVLLLVAMIGAVTLTLERKQQDNSPDT
jgi:NADH-quinone oxidoreductase subunit J